MDTDTKNFYALNKDEPLIPQIQLNVLPLQTDYDNTTSLEEVPPNGGYGWVCVACVFMINAHTWGINSAFGVFLAYDLTHDIYRGATPFQFAFIGSLSIAQALFVSPAITYSTRKWGTGVTMFIGNVFLTAALLGASFAKTFWQLLLAQGICFGWGMGFLYVGSIGIIPQWFSDRRSLAVGITASGVGFGGIIYTLAANAAVSSLNPAWAFRILAACGFVVNTTCALLLKDRNKTIQPRQAIFDFRLLLRVEILLIVGWGAMSELGYIVLYYSLPSYATSIGLTAKQGSVVDALLSVGLAVGRPVVGYYSDALGRINMAMLMTGFCGLICLVLWVFAKSYAVLLLFALLAGVVSGTFWSTIAPVAAEVVGLKELPTALSMTWLLLVVPCTFAEPIAVKMLAKPGTGQWLKSQLFVGFMYLGAALCTLALRWWTLNKMDKKKARESIHSRGSKQDRSTLSHTSKALKTLFAAKKA